MTHFYSCPECPFVGFEYLSKPDTLRVMERLDPSPTVTRDNKKIKIPFSDSDIEELREGQTLNWSFPVEGSASSEWIDVEIKNEEEESF